MRAKCFVATLWWLCLTGAFAQPVDMAPICASYAGHPFSTRDSQPVSLSCEQLTAISAKVNFPHSLFSHLGPHLLPFGRFSIDDAADLERTSAGNCRRSVAPSSTYRLRCNYVVEGADAFLEASTDSEGYINVLEVHLIDFRGRFDPLAVRLALDPATLTETFYFFVLDLMIAKNATFGVPDLTVVRVGTGLRVKIVNIPRTAAPRVRLG